jgi:hypothetical protein
VRWLAVGLGSGIAVTGPRTAAQHHRRGVIGALPGLKVFQGARERLDQGVGRPSAIGQEPFTPGHVRRAEPLLKDQIGHQPTHSSRPFDPDVLSALGFQ